MKVKTLVLSLLVMASLSAVLGLRERPPIKAVRKAVCIVKCEDAPRQKLCKRTCKEDQTDIPVLDEEAKANPRSVCQSNGEQVLQVDPAVYIVERRTESGDWVNEGVKEFFGRTIYHRSATPGGRFQWRFTRALANGISRPQITEWITTRGPGVKPPKILDIWVQCLAVQAGIYFNGKPKVTAQIAFKRPEDTSCAYEFICSQDQSPFRRTDQIYITGRFGLRPQFEDLVLGANFTVGVQPKAWENYAASGDDTSTKFRTPSEWPAGAGPEICVPDETEGLEATVTRHRGGNNYDVTVTWERSDSGILDYFIVNLISVGGQANSPVSHNVSGTATETIFEGVRISQQFDVSIRPWSILGRGPETSKRFTIPSHLG